MKLALNQATVKRWTLAEAVTGCVASGIDGIGLWRDRVEEVGVDEAARLVREAGLQVTSLCRGGFFTSDGWEPDNRRAVEEAAALGTDVLVLVCGGLPPGSKDLPAARQRVVDAVGALAPYAADHGVQLAIEALHPMFGADRSVICGLRQALDIAELFPAYQVGVVVDTYHVWWEPDVECQIARAGAGSRLAAFQISDWVLPLPADSLLGRGQVGDGTIDVGHLARCVVDAGYQGFCEVEIFNADIWEQPGAATVATMVERYQRHVLAALDRRASEAGAWPEVRNPKRSHWERSSGGAGPSDASCHEV